MTMKFIWYIVSALVIFLILLSHPQASNLGTFGNQAKILNSTRSTQQGTQLLITLSIAIFFLFTIFFAINIQIID